MERLIGVNSNCYHGFSIDEAIEGIKNAGFNYIELTATKGWTEHVFPSDNFSELVRIKQKLKDINLIPFALSGHSNLMDEDRLQDFIENIELASFFDCNYIVSSIGEAHLDDKKSVSKGDIANNIEKIIPYLKEEELKLVLETHGDHGTGKDLNEIVKLIDSKWVSINYDTANVIFYGNVNLKRDLLTCIDNVEYVHLKDKSGEVKEWNFPALGNGYIDFPGVFSLFKEHNNFSPFSIEIEFTEEGPKDLNEVNQAVKQSYNYLKKNGLLDE